VPSPGDSSALKDVAAASKTNAWAVGWSVGTFGTSTVVLHWDGTAWKRQPSADPDQSVPLDNLLYGVTAIPHGGGLGGGGLRRNVPDPADRPLLLTCSI
jgi:hypothetical protein